MSTSFGVTRAGTPRRQHPILRFQGPEAAGERDLLLGSQYWPLQHQHAIPVHSSLNRGEIGGIDGARKIDAAGPGAKQGMQCTN
jgi:hypothetical protein